MFTRDRVVLWVAAASVLLVTASLVWSETHPDYRRFQAEFRELVQERLGSQRAAATPEGVQQIWIAELDRVDRCTSCHLGVSWKDLKGAPAPFALHPEAPLEHHPFAQYGCTLCHGGQGTATRLPDAHGWGPHWEDKLLDKQLASEYGMSDPHGFIQMRCNGCHRYRRELAGAQLVNRGKEIINAKGCRACHFMNGRGGSIGPDLTRVGEKAADQYDFSRLASLPSVFAWHIGHLQNPRSFSPGSIMPEFGFSTADAQAVALVLMSWRDVKLPARYLPGAVVREAPSAEELEREQRMTTGEGRFFVQKTCFICHDVSSLGIESATKIGPDLAIAVEDAPRRFGIPLDEFLKNPSGTMSVVLARQIKLTDAERDEAIGLLKVAYQRHLEGKRSGSTGPGAK